MKCATPSTSLYLRERGTVEWVKYKDENTSFFQAFNTVKNKRNSVQSLFIVEGEHVFFYHKGKAGILW